MPDLITIRQGTSLQEVNQALGQLGDNDKIRGKKNDDGSTTLYTSNKRNLGIKEFFTGHVTRRQENARQALNNLFDGLSKKEGIGPSAKQMLTDLQQPEGGGKIRGTQVKDMLLQSRLALELPNVLSEGLRDNDESKLSRCRDLLSGKLSEAMNSRTPGEQTHFAISDGKQVLDRLVGRMHDGLGENAGPIGKTYDQSSNEVKAFLDDVYHQATLNLNDRIIDDNSIQVGGKVYTLDEHIVDSGFGSIDRYKSGDEYLVLKKPLDNISGTAKEKFGEASIECLSHLKAQSGGSDKVVELKGAMRLPGGGIAIALEYAPNKDGLKAMENVIRLNSGADNKILDDHRARLVQTTMLKDMLESLKDVQDNGVIHRDIKPPNFVMDGEGKLKMMDFGTSRVGSTYTYKDTEKIENPLWTAPETFSPFLEAREQVNHLNGLEAKAKIKLRNEFGGDEQKLKTLIKETEKDFSTQRKDLMAKTTATVSGAVDTWSLGITARQMLEGKIQLFEGKMDSDVENMLHDLKSQPGKQLFQRPEGLDKFGEAFVDLIEGLTNPDPQKRLTVEKALESPIFKEPGVGSTEVRDLLTNPLFRKEQLTDDEKELLRLEGAKIGG